MKRLALFCMLFLTLAAWAQKLYYLPTATPSDDEKDTTSGDYIIRLAARDAKAAIRMVREHADE